MNLLTIHKTIAKKIAPHGAYVTCEKCGIQEPVDTAKALASGWPECCGYTMTFVPRKK